MSARSKRAKQKNEESVVSPRDISAQINEELRKIQADGSKTGNASINFNFEKLHRGPIEYFSPKDYGDAKTFHEMIIETAETKVNDRLFRVLAVSFVPFILLILLALYGNKEALPINENTNKNNNNGEENGLTVNFMFGSALFCMFTFYFLHIFSIFCTANPSCFCLKNDKNNKNNSNNNKNKNGTDSNDMIMNHRSLFRVYSVNSMIPDNTDMSICYRALLFKYQPITSISEFSAIQGGIAQTMLLIISSYSWVVLLCAMAPELHKYGFYVLSVGDICELIGCFGLVLIGTFELDPWNKTMQRFHNTGAIMGSLTLIGFAYQQYVIAIKTSTDINVNTLKLPVFLTVFALIGYISWTYFGKVADKYDPVKKSGNKANMMDEKEIKEIRNTVTSISLKNVISEAVVLYCGATAMCLWLMNFDTCHKHNFCRI